MSNSQNNADISALLARRPETLKHSEIEALKAGLIAGAAVISEGQIYNEVAGLLRHDPHAANNLLLSMNGGFDDFEPTWSDLRVHLLAVAYARIQELDANSTTHVFDTISSHAGGLEDRAREATFRATPGQYLPGAMTSSVRLFKAEGFGIVSYEGQDWAWTYTSAGMGRSDLSKLVTFVDEKRLLGGILVGSPEVEHEVVLPEGYLFVAIELSNGGRSA